MTKGERIRLVRETSGKKKISMAEFADRIGSTASAVSQWENGQREPSQVAIRLISKEFHINETWLLTGEGEMQDAMTSEQRIAQVVQALTVRSDVVKSAMITALSRMDEEDLRKLLRMILNAMTDNGIDVNEFLN